MNANPYAADAADHFDEPTRTSVLAIASLVLAIIGLVIFCVGGGVLGAVGALLGVIALVIIGGSGGRVGGSGIAISGIVVGLLSALLTGVLAFGAVFGIQTMLGMADPIEQVMARDYAAVRSSLTSSASSTVTDEQIDAFAEAIEAEFGTLVLLPDGIMPYFNGFKNVADAMGDPNGNAYGGNNTIPVPVEFDQGHALFWLAIDPNDPSASGVPLLKNLGVVLPTGELWLAPLPGGTQIAAPETGDPSGGPSEEPTDEPTNESGDNSGSGGG